MKEINKYNFGISYDFYKCYYDIEGFRLILENRKDYYKDKLRFLGIFDCPEKDLLDEFFVEIFSWTVMDKRIMNKLKETSLDPNVKKLLEASIQKVRSAKYNKETITKVYDVKNKCKTVKEARLYIKENFDVKISTSTISKIWNNEYI